MTCRGSALPSSSGVRKSPCQKPRSQLVATVLSDMDHGPIWSKVASCEFLGSGIQASLLQFHVLLSVFECLASHHTQPCAGKYLEAVVMNSNAGHC